VQQLGKDPKDYPNANSMPSVQVALKLMEKGKHIRAKDVMSFVITGDSSGSAERAAKNAYPLEDLIKKDSDLLPDIDYYLHKQILPPVERLCAPISGTNVTRLADCLGLDTSKYRVSTAGGDGAAPDAGIQPLESQIPDAVRFKDAAPLRLRCRACKHVFSYLGLLPSPQEREEADEKKAAAGTVGHEGIVCPAPACGAALPTLSLTMQLDAQLRRHVARYYAGWLRCDDAACGARTRQMSVYGHRCLGPRGLGAGCLGRMRYDYAEKALYNQLLYLGSLFDVDKARKALARVGATMDAEERQKFEVLGECNRERFGTARDVVKGYLERNGRQWVQMDSLFAFAAKKTD
jgi:DNA polymerase alpha subunit A